MYLGMSGIAGVRSGSAPSWGTASSYNPQVNASSAAFGPGATTPMASTADVLKPNDGFGLSFTIGVVAIGLLIFIRYSLPN
jgi:hypothetical protein